MNNFYMVHEESALNKLLYGLQVNRLPQVQGEVLTVRRINRANWAFTSGPD